MGEEKVRQKENDERDSYDLVGIINKAGRQASGLSVRFTYVSLLSFIAFLDPSTRHFCAAAGPAGIFEGAGCLLAVLAACPPKWKTGTAPMIKLQLG